MSEECVPPGEEELLLGSEDDPIANRVIGWFPDRPHSADEAEDVSAREAEEDRRRPTESAGPTGFADR